MPEPGPTPKSQALAWHWFLKPDLGLKAKLTGLVKIWATAGYWWRSKVNMTEQFTIYYFLLKI